TLADGGFDVDRLYCGKPLGPNKTFRRTLPTDLSPAHPVTMMESAGLPFNSFSGIAGVCSSTRKEVASSSGRRNEPAPLTTFHPSGMVAFITISRGAPRLRATLSGIATMLPLL